MSDNIKTISYIAEPTAQAFHQDDRFFRVLKGPVGCLPADSEFLTPSGWKRMDSYQEGVDLCAQWNPVTNTIEFVPPSAYIVEPCEEFIRFSSGSLVMELSEEHRVPHWDWKGDFVVKTAKEIEHSPSRRKIPTTFCGPDSDSLGMSEDLIRFAVMMHADGHYLASCKTAVVSLRKQRKKDRLRELLKRLDIRWTENIHKARPMETIFSFDPPYRGKRFTGKWWSASYKELRIILDELKYWDGLAGIDGCHEETRYYSSHKEDAEFIQYASHAVGRRATIRIDDTQDERWAPCYIVQLFKQDGPKNVASIREHTLISRIPSQDGGKYCFTVPSGFFIARCEGSIFVTGNCGKSSACVMDIMYRGFVHPPGPDGVRRPRWVIIRATYGELKATTIPTWNMWVPSSICTVVYDSPIRARVQQKLGDGTELDMEVLFLALDREEDAEKLKSFEVTGAWLNEASELTWTVFQYLSGRVGRWNPDKDDVKRWRGIIADTNPPRTTHWLYNLFEEKEVPPEIKMYTYPPAVYFDHATKKWEVNPDAENLRWLKPSGVEYYRQQLVSGSDDYIRVMLAGEYGMTRIGKPVFPQYAEKDHVAKEVIRPDPGMPLLIGFDFGLNPAAVFAQMTQRGGLRILDVLIPADESLEDFVDDYVLPLIQKKYPRYKIYCVGDPAARGRSGLDKRTPFDVLMSRNIRCIPAPTNSFVPRKEAVDFFLNKIDGLKIDPSLTYLREAFGGGYVYGIIRGDTSRHKERPEKNHYSHGMDAVQYVALHVRSGSGAIKRSSRENIMDKAKKFLWA